MFSLIWLLFCLILTIPQQTAAVPAPTFAICSQPNITAPLGFLVATTASHYANHLYCITLIIAPVGKLVMITFESLCTAANDFLTVKDGAPLASPFMLFQSGCSTPLPGSLNSTSNVLRVVFTSNAAVVNTGFRLKWSFIDPLDCGTPRVPLGANTPSCASGTTTGKSCSFTCSAGYTGGGNLTCRGNATWTAASSCAASAEKTCHLPSTGYNDAGCPSGSTVSKCTPACAEGYHASAKGGPTVTACPTNSGEFTMGMTCVDFSATVYSFNFTNVDGQFDGTVAGTVTLLNGGADGLYAASSILIISAPEQLGIPVPFEMKDQPFVNQFIVLSGQIARWAVSTVKNDFDLYLTYGSQCFLANPAQQDVFDGACKTLTFGAASAEKTCHLPSTGYNDAGCPSGSTVSKCTPACADGYHASADGGPTVTACLTDSGEFNMGMTCVGENTCHLPSTGYDDAGCPSGRTVSTCTPACAPGYHPAFGVSPVVLACPTDSGEFTMGVTCVAF